MHEEPATTAWQPLIILTSRGQFHLNRKQRHLWHLPAAKRFQGLTCPPRSFRLKSTASEDILKVASWDHSGGKRWDIFAYCFRCLKYSLRRDHHNSTNKTKSHRQQTHSPAIGLMCCPAGMVERKNKGIGSQAQRTCVHTAGTHRERRPWKPNHF